MSLLDAPNGAIGSLVDTINALNPFGPHHDTERGPDFPKGFIITEVVNGADLSDTQVRLVGNMMPMIPFKFGGEQRITKDYYPGCIEPAMHVLGSRETDLVIHGKLKDKRLKNKSLYGASYEVSKALDTIRLRGNLVRIELGDWKRYGFLEKTEFDLNKKSDVEYNLTFSLIGFNLPTNCKILQSTKNTPLDINAELASALADFNDNYSTVPKSMPRSLSDLINAAINVVAGGINLVTGFVDTVISTAEDVEKSAFRAIGLIKNARANISSFRRRIGAISSDYNTIANEKDASLNFKSAMTNQNYMQGAISAMAALSALLAQMEAQFKKIAINIPLARHLVVAGDTLQKISIKFYNTADHWQDIMTHNNLTSTQLVLGSVLEIPRV